MNRSQLTIPNIKALEELAAFVETISEDRWLHDGDFDTYDRLGRGDIVWNGSQLGFFPPREELKAAGPYGAFDWFLGRYRVDPRDAQYILKWFNSDDIVCHIYFEKGANWKIEEYSFCKTPTEAADRIREVIEGHRWMTVL